MWAGVTYADNPHAAGSGLSDEVVHAFPAPVGPSDYALDWVTWF